MKDETTTMILNVRRNVASEKYPSPRMAKLFLDESVLKKKLVNFG